MMQQQRKQWPGTALCRLVGTNLIIPHIVGNAGVLRNFSAYLAQLLDVNGSTNLQARFSYGSRVQSHAYAQILPLIAGSWPGRFMTCAPRLPFRRLAIYCLRGM